MSRICVCGLDDVPDLAERMRPNRLISVLPKCEQPPTPPQLQAYDHLRVLVDDVDEPQSGFTAPARAHVDALIAFLRDTPPGASILIHCLAGVSRSPAAALVALALDAPGRELAAAKVLRRAGPFVWPNRLIIQLADAALQRDGALVRALDGMGEADWSCEMAPFMLSRTF